MFELNLVRPLSFCVIIVDNTFPKLPHHGKLNNWISSQLVKYFDRILCGRKSVFIVNGWVYVRSFEFSNINAFLGVCKYQIQVSWVFQTFSVYIQIRNYGTLQATDIYNDAIMSAVASQITGLTIVYPTVYSDGDQRKHQSSASLAFVRGIHRWPVNSPHKRVTPKMFPFDDVIMELLPWQIGQSCHWRNHGGIW